jgi:cytochrome c biogenesis factor
VPAGALVFAPHDDARPLSATMLVALAFIGSLVALALEIRGATLDAAPAMIGLGVVIVATVYATVRTRSSVVSSPTAARRLGFLGALALAIGLSGTAFRRQIHVTIAPGATATAVDPFGRHWTFTNQGVSRFQVLNRHVTAGALDVARDARSIGVLTTGERQYVDGRDVSLFNPWVDVAVRLGFLEDLYLALTTVREDETIGVRVDFNPLVVWTWIGIGLMAIGGMVALSSLGAAR